MFENAKWIARDTWKLWRVPGMFDMPPSPYIAKTFVLKESPVKAILNIAALGQGAYFINGNRVPDSFIPQHPSNYVKTVVYCDYDITSMLKAGKNRVGIMIGNNRYADQLAGFHLACPKAICQLDITYADGTTESVVSDSCFKTAPSHVLFTYARCGEIQDATKLIPDWCDADFDDSNWDNAKILPGPGGKLRPTNCPPRRMIEILEGKELAHGVFDFGKVTSGFANVKIKGKAGNKVEILYSEDLASDGQHVEQMFNRFSNECREMKHKGIYILSGNDDEFEDLFSYHGFRYVEITGEYETLEVTAKVVHTDIQPTSAFESDNEIVNSIYKICKNSILTNCQVAMVDCPQREQNEWTGDGMLTAETIAMQFDAYEMYYEWMLKFQDDQMPDGKIPCIVPAMTPSDLNFGNGLDWVSAIIHIPYYCAKYSGNKKIAVTMWENMERMMNFFRRTSNTNLIDTGLGDWASYNGDLGNTEISDTCYYRLDALMMSEMATLLGKDASYYLKLAEDIKRDFRKKYVKGGKLDDAGVTGIVAAVYAGMLERNEAKQELARALEIIKDQGGIMGGVHCNRFMFDAFSDHGFAQELFDIVTDTTIPGYGKIVADGYTALPENFNYGVINTENSRNHQFKAMFNSWLFTYFAGIKVNGFGFGDVVIEPHFVKNMSSISATLCGITVSYNDKEIMVKSPYPFRFIYNAKEENCSAGEYIFKR